VWAFGAVVFEMIAGCRAFDGDLRGRRPAPSPAPASARGPLRSPHAALPHFYHPVEDQSWLLALRSNAEGEIAAMAIDSGPGSKEIVLTRVAATTAAR